MTSFVLFLALWHPPAWIAHAVNVAATVADVETTQACLRAKTCKEGNPMMPSNRAGAYGVTLGLAGLETLLSEHARKQHQRAWWVAPLLGGGVHASAATNNTIRFK